MAPSANKYSVPTCTGSDGFSSKPEVYTMLAGCRENNNENVPVKSFQRMDHLVVKLNQTTPASNPSNPFDYIGVQHNIGLDLLRYYVKATGNTTRSGMEDYVSRYFKSNFGVTFNPLTIQKKN